MWNTIVSDNVFLRPNCRESDHTLMETCNACHQYGHRGRDCDELRKFQGGLLKKAMKRDNNRYVELSQEEKQYLEAPVSVLMQVYGDHTTVAPSSVDQRAARSKLPRALKGIGAGVTHRKA